MCDRSTYNRTEGDFGVDSAAMKQHFDPKLAESYMRATPWIVANHKKEDAAPESMIGENYPPRLMIIESG
jgi:hypothetical protein